MAAPAPLVVQPRLDLDQPGEQRQQPLGRPRLLRLPVEVDGGERLCLRQVVPPSPADQFTAVTVPPRPVGGGEAELLDGAPAEEVAQFLGGRAGDVEPPHRIVRVEDLTGRAEAGQVAERLL
ncbi:hypothetical protein AB0I85_17315 [Micromonospora echinofusca]